MCCIRPLGLRTFKTVRTQCILDSISSEPRSSLEIDLEKATGYWTSGSNQQENEKI